MGPARRGVYVALVGARFERRGVMEAAHMLVGPGGICFFLPKFPVLNFQIQPVVLGLCTIIPNYAD